MSQQPWGLQLTGHALRHIAGNSYKTETLKTWTKYRTGAPRIHVQGPHVLTDTDALTEHLRPTNPHELRGSTQGPEAVASEPEDQRAADGAGSGGRGLR